MRADGRSLDGWNLLATCALLTLVALFAYAPIFAVDFFWHLKLGELIASTREIPRVDLFSAVHPERPYVQFQWLWELLAYWAFALQGLGGVRLFQVSILTASFARLSIVTGRLFLRPSVGFCFCALALVLFEDRFQARPAATALGFLALILPWLVDPAARRALYAWLPAALVGCLWSNIHGGESLLMPLCFGALSVGAALERMLRRSAPALASAPALMPAMPSVAPGAEPSREPDAGAGTTDGVVPLLLASSAGVLLSPSLLSGLIDWAHAIGPQLASGNKEWRPSYTMLENGFSPSFVLIGLGPTVVALAYAGEQVRRTRALGFRHAPWSEWLLCAGLLVLAHQAVRNAFLCLVPLAFSLRRWCAQPVAPPVTRRVERLCAALGATFLLVAFHDHVIVGYGGLSAALETLPEDLAPDAFPEELTDFMREAGIAGPILNDGRWGGYLIWQLWPSCRVFVDTRHDLTPEMWPVFLNAHAPRTRPAAMDYAFRRWKVELAVFRGPTFPLIAAPPDWQLLFKAGDQELYQRRAGKNARANFERAARWLGDHPLAAGLSGTHAQIASEVGAKLWLAAPHRRRMRERARELLSSPSQSDVAEGLSLEAYLSFEVGRYREALPLLERSLALEPTNVQDLYRLALAAFASGDRERAKAALTTLRAHIAELSKPQLGRLASLEAELSR